MRLGVPDATALDLSLPGGINGVEIKPPSLSGEPCPGLGAGGTHTPALNTYGLLNQCCCSDRPPSFPLVESGRWPMTLESQEGRLGVGCLFQEASLTSGPIWWPPPSPHFPVHVCSHQHCSHAGRDYLWAWVFLPTDLRADLA